MKRSSRVILIAIVAFTFAAVVLKQPALLSGTAMGLFALYFQPSQKKKTALGLRHLPVSQQVPSSQSQTSSNSGDVTKIVHKSVKARTYIDDPNILSGAYANNLSVKYEHLAPALVQQGYNIEKTFLYVMGKPESSGYQFFLNRIKKSGIEVIERSARKIRDDLIRKDIDTWLATDIALGASEVDTVVLVTGDNDFSYTVARLQEMKKKVIVVGIEATTSKELREQADQWLNIEHLEGVCERKVRPPKLSTHDATTKHRYPQPVKPRPKRTVKRPIIKPNDRTNRTTA